MKQAQFRLAALIAVVLLVPGGASATTRDISDLQTTELTLHQSVISELSGQLLQDPYDEFLRRPYNLSFVNLERNANLSPWPGQDGEQKQYVDALIGNNANTNVRNGSDVLQGTYIRQSMQRLAWGVSAAYLADDVSNTDAVATSSFADGEELTGYDARVAAGLRVSDRARIGAGLSAFDRRDEVTDSSFSQGVGGFFSLQDLQQSGMAADVGLRHFISESTSWNVQLAFGTGETNLDDFSETLDGGGAVTSRFVVTQYAVDDTYVEITGGLNRRHADDRGEMQFRVGYRMAEHELANTDLSFTETGGAIAPSLELLSQTPVGRDTIFAEASTLFIRGWTQIFAGAQLEIAQVDGSTEVDSLGTVVLESIDDTDNRLSLIMGLRQPLWNEKFRLVAHARADAFDSSQDTIIDLNSSGSEFRQTTTSYAIGIETVLSNMTFDLAWLSGETPAPGGSTAASRQVIDIDRLVISAAFGW